MEKEENSMQVTQEEVKWLNELGNRQQSGVGLPYVMVEQLQKDFEEVKRLDTISKQLQEELQKCTNALVRLDSSISTTSMMILRLKREAESKVPYEIG